MINNAHQMEWIYDELGINLNELGAIMAMMTPPEIDLPEEWLYYANDKTRFWIDGVVGRSHITLRYGMLPGITKKHVDAVLEGWKIDDIYIKEILVFDSPYKDENYKCIVLAVESLALIDANKRLGLLPNVATFKNYTPHITMAYLKEEFVTESVDLIRKQIQNYKPRFLEIDYGDQIR